MNNHTALPAYPKDTAGHRMTVDVPVVHEAVTIKEVHDILSTKGRAYKTINYIYVLSDKNVLVGVLSVRDIFSEKQAARIGDICKKSSLVYVHPETHQERAAYLALQHNIKAIPVVDKNHVFLGEITADSILTILHKEMHEDTLKRVGIRHPDALKSNVMDQSLLVSIRHRLPWLLIGLFGGIAMAKVIGLFEETLSQNIALAAFIPLIVYMSSAVGTQMETYIIRDLAVERSIPFARYFFKNLIVVTAIALFLAIILSIAERIVYPGIHMGFVIGTALFVSVMSSIMTGLLIPYAFSKFSLDPADASGPVATIVQDMMSIVIYFGVASMLL